MQIKFQTKEESNTAQRVAFLKLSKPERFFRFLDLIRQSKDLPSKKREDKSANFQIVFQSK